MTLLVPISNDHQGAIERLSALVTPLFRGSGLTPPPGHLLIASQCRIQGCRRTGRPGDGLCAAHDELWSTAHVPDLSLDQWAARVAGGPLPCRVTRCFFGRSRGGLCTRHAYRWRTQGSPPVEDWVTTADDLPGAHAECLVHGCRLWSSDWHGFCVAHGTRFHSSRGPHSTDDLRDLTLQQLREAHRREADAFILAEERRNARSVGVDLAGLGPGLRLELQYLFQIYLEHGPRRVTLANWDAVVRSLRRHQVTTLTEATASRWITVLGLERNTDAKTVLRWGCDQLDHILNGDGWDREYDHDTWRLSCLGYGGYGHALLVFDKIGQPWLRELTKQWTRHRLCTGISPGGASGGVRALTSFSMYLDDLRRPPRGLRELTHTMVQGWCSHLAQGGCAASTRMGLIGQVSVFLRDVHRRGWAPTLPSTTIVLPEDFPPREPRKARGLSEHVMAQIEGEGALALLPVRYRLIVDVLLQCGLRSGDCLALDVDCLLRDGDGHAYLQYLNHKMKRTAFVPIDDALAARLEHQRRTVLDTYPTHPPGLLLFPSATANPTGTKAFSPSGLHGVFQRWLADLEVRDEQGHRVHITPHQLRHTFGTRLINRDVKQHIVQQLLDHTSPEMTAHYARLHDRTVRQAWAKARLLDIHGNPAHDAGDAMLADATWTRHSVEKVKQTLPNGYCGMPQQSPCDHANVCLTCPLFITSADFLPQHQAQLSATLELIDISNRRGHQRLVESNQKVATNLRHIIAACEQDPTEEDTADAR